jgi:hypothetical protein
VKIKKRERLVAQVTPQGFDNLDSACGSYKTKATPVKQRLLATMASELVRFRGSFVIPDFDLLFEHGVTCRSSTASRQSPAPRTNHDKADADGP